MKKDVIRENEEEKERRIKEEGKGDEEMKKGENAGETERKR